MDKQQYKRVMEQIRMSDACEQRILAAVQNGGQPVSAKFRVTWKKKTIVAAATAACVSVVSVLSVAAVQNASLLQLLFPTKTEVVDTALQAEDGLENFTVSGFDGVTIEPLGVVRDAKGIYIMMHATIENGDENYFDNLEEMTELGQQSKINGISFWDETREDGFRVAETNFDPRKQDDGSYTLIYQLKFEEILEDLMFSLQINLGRWTEEDEQNPLGTISADVNCEQTVTSVVSEMNQPISDTATINRVTLHALGMELCGSGSVELPSSMYQDFLGIVELLTANGETVSAKISSGEKDPTAQSWKFTYTFDEPIDPEQVVSIQIENHTIPLE